MNTLQWEPTPTLPAAIEQLKLLADARQSPVIALMKSLEYQGGAGRESVVVGHAGGQGAARLRRQGRRPRDGASRSCGAARLDLRPGAALVAGRANANGGASSDVSLQRFWNA